MENLSFDVQGIGRVKLIQDCGSSLTVEDASGTRLSLPASRCVRVDQTAAALADQFTGEDQTGALAGTYPEDLGAAMAAAERGEVECLLCARCNQITNGGGYASEEVGLCAISLEYKAIHFPRTCADFEPLPIEPLRTEGYRVGDAHDARDPAAGEG